MAAVSSTADPKETLAEVLDRGLTEGETYGAGTEFEEEYEEDITPPVTQKELQKEISRATRGQSADANHLGGLLDLQSHFIFAGADVFQVQQQYPAPLRSYIGNKSKMTKYSMSADDILVIALIRLAYEHPTRLNTWFNGLDFAGTKKVICAEAKISEEELTAWCSSAYKAHAQMLSKYPPQPRGSVPSERSYSVPSPMVSSVAPLEPLASVAPLTRPIVVAEPCPRVGLEVIAGQIPHPLPITLSELTSLNRNTSQGQIEKFLQSNQELVGVFYLLYMKTNLNTPEWLPEQIRQDIKRRKDGGFGYLQQEQNLKYATFLAETVVELKKSIRGSLTWLGISRTPTWISSVTPLWRFIQDPIQRGINPIPPNYSKGVFTVAPLPDASSFWNDSYRVVVQMIRTYSRYFSIERAEDDRTKYLPLVKDGCPTMSEPTLMQIQVLIDQIDNIPMEEVDNKGVDHFVATYKFGVKDFYLARTSIGRLASSLTLTKNSATLVDAILLKTAILYSPLALLSARGTETPKGRVQSQNAAMQYAGRIINFHREVFPSHDELRAAQGTNDLRFIQICINQLNTLLRAIKTVCFKRTVTRPTSQLQLMKVKDILGDTIQISQ
jgi:hypothetical protein